MHVQSCCFAQQTYCFFDVLVAVAVVVATFPRRKLTGPGLLLVCKVANPNIWIMSCTMLGVNRVFSHDVTAAILVSQTNPLGVELFSYANAFFCSNKFA